MITSKVVTVQSTGLNILIIKTDPATSEVVNIIRAAAWPVGTRDTPERQWGREDH